jgi:hypothetical protein
MPEYRSPRNPSPSPGDWSRCRPRTQTAPGSSWSRFPLATLRAVTHECLDRQGKRPFRGVSARSQSGSQRTQTPRPCVADDTTVLMITPESATVTVLADADLHSVTVNMRDISDSMPTLAATARSPTAQSASKTSTTPGSRNATGSKHARSTSAPWAFQSGSAATGSRSSQPSHIPRTSPATATTASRWPSASPAGPPPTLPGLRQKDLPRIPHRSRRPPDRLATRLVAVDQRGDAPNRRPGQRAARYFRSVFINLL